MQTPREGKFNPPKIDKQLRGVKDAALGLTFEQIQAHCDKVAAKKGSYSSCVDVNCYFQREYVHCYEALRDKQACIEVIRDQIVQLGGYSFSHVKI